MIDPISAGLGIVGLGLQIYGNMSAAENARKSSEVRQSIANEERNINEQKRTQMELSARRDSLQIYRNQQRQRAMATQAAVNQGASRGSGLQGGIAGVDAGSFFNLAGIDQNLQIGRNIFGINDRISGYKQQLASYESDAATDAGLASLGGSIMKSSGTIGQIVGNYTSGFGSTGGNYQGMPWSKNTGGLY